MLDEDNLANLDTTNLIERLENNDEPIAGKSWDSIIPQADIDRLNEEKLKQLQAELNLGPRKRNKVIIASTFTMYA